MGFLHSSGHVTVVVPEDVVRIRKQWAAAKDGFKGMKHIRGEINAPLVSKRCLNSEHNHSPAKIIAFC